MAHNEEIKETFSNTPFSVLKRGEVALAGYKLTQILSDGQLLGKFGFVQKVKEHHHDVYTKIVEREIQGGVKITDRAYVLEIFKDEAKGCVRATYSLNGRNIFAMDLMCDYHRARHVAIKAVIAWCKKSWRNAGV